MVGNQSSAEMALGCRSPVVRLPRPWSTRPALAHLLCCSSAMGSVIATGSLHGCWEHCSQSLTISFKINISKCVCTIHLIKLTDCNSYNAPIYLLNKSPGPETWCLGNPQCQRAPLCHLMAKSLFWEMVAPGSGKNSGIQSTWHRFFRFDVSMPCNFFYGQCQHDIREHLLSQDASLETTLSSRIYSRRVHHYRVYSLKSTAEARFTPQKKIPGLTPRREPTLRIHTPQCNPAKDQLLRGPLYSWVHQENSNKSDSLRRSQSLGAVL